MKQCHCINDIESYSLEEWHQLPCHRGFEEYLIYCLHVLLHQHLLELVVHLLAHTIGTHIGLHLLRFQQHKEVQILLFVCSMSVLLACRDLAVNDANVIIDCLGSVSWNDVIPSVPSRSVANV